MIKNNSGYSIDYKFDYDEKHPQIAYEYNIPYTVFCDAIRDYFDRQSVNLDGTDNAIWNVLLSLDYRYDKDDDHPYSEILENIFEEEESWLKEKCKDQAYEDFKEFYGDYYSDPDNVDI